MHRDVTALKLRGYAVCGAPRSGSNYFCELLTTTGVLGRPREYFNGEARRRLDDPDYPDDPEAQAARILTMGRTANGVYALKLFPGLFDRVAPHIRLTQALPNLNYVRLRRRDVLGQAISWVRSIQTGAFRSTEETSAEPRYDASLIHAYIGQVCQRSARWDMYFARTGLAPLELVYEDVAADPQAAIERVGDLMQVTPRPQIDFSAVRLRMQRDAISQTWRERFLDERGDPSTIDPLSDMTATL